MLQQLNDELGQLQDELTKSKDAIFRLEKKRQALPILKEYQHVLQQLQTYPDPFSFPEQGMKRLEQLNEKLLPLRSELSVLRHNLNEYTSKRNAIWNSFLMMLSMNSLNQFWSKSNNGLTCIKA